MKYTVDVIDKSCKFYKLDDQNGKRIATIEYSGWKFYKYAVSFAYDSIKDNLEKSKSFRTLKEAKEYVAKVLEV